MSLRIPSACLFIAFALVVFRPETLRACSCIPDVTSCGNAVSADAIFTAKVIKREPRQQKYIRTTITILEVTEVLKGEVPSTITFGDETTLSSCDFSFDHADEFLVYAYRDHNNARFVTSVCSGTHALRGSRDEVLWLKTFLSSPTGTIAGRVGPFELFSHFFDDTTPSYFSGFSVFAKGRAETYRGFVQPSGAFEIERIPPGEYLVVPEVPPGYQIHPERYAKVQVTRQSCVRTDFDPIPTGVIEGTVDWPADGTPRELMLGLIRKDGKMAHQGIVHSSSPTFRFDRVPPGEYVIGINVARYPSVESPFTTAYYPAKASLAEAERITIDMMRFSYDDLHIRLPQPLPPRSFKVRTVWPDGTPARSVSVWLQDPTTGAEVLGEMTDASTDSRGVAVLRGVAGVPYAIAATMVCVDAWVRVAPQLIGAGESTAEVMITIPLSPCRAYSDLSLEPRPFSVEPE